LVPSALQVLFEDDRRQLLRADLAIHIETGSFGQLHIEQDEAGLIFLPTEGHDPV
jgi:hypothetical protein